MISIYKHFTRQTDERTNRWMDEQTDVTPAIPMYGALKTTGQCSSCTMSDRFPQETQNKSVHESQL